MSAEMSRRGGAAVGLLEDLDPVESVAVMYLRLWCDSPAAKAQVKKDFAISLGDAHGQSAVEAFEQICELCARHGRRPLMRHAVRCKCLGADEACFANFIGYASDGAREDAMLLAATMVRPDMAPALAGLAEEFGLALKSMTLSLEARYEMPRQGATLH